MPELERISIEALRSFDPNERAGSRSTATSPRRRRRCGPAAARPTSASPPRCRKHRKGAQGALLAARIRRAGELGCETIVTETGKRRDDRPSSSYCNILRFGFEERYVVPNWLRPAT